MLLRLLPLPTPSAPAPPTILFTLPSPTASSSSSSSSSPYNPYTPHHLPAPPALLLHHQTCKLNNLPCPTLLTGEASSWISTIVQEVTFLPALGEIQILLVDGSGVVMPLREAGAGKVLDQVRDHVLESGRLMEKGASAAAAAEKVERARESVRPTLRKGESMLMSFLGPLLSPRKEETMQVVSVQQQSVVGRELSARQHRRLARSLLVDCYRRWVLTGLKALLPPTYILFTSQSIIQTHSQTLTKTESELRVLLSISGHPTTPSPPASPTLSSRSTSPHSSSKSSLPFPPSAALPTHLRNTYATHLSCHVETQSSIVALEKLVRKHEREERRNRWEDSLPAIEKKHRAAPSPLVVVGSPLQQSWSFASPSSSSSVSEDGNGVPPLSPTSSLWSNSSYASSSSEESSGGEEEEGEEPVKVVKSSNEHEDEDYSYTLEDVVAIKALPARRRISAGLAGVERGEGEVVRGLGF